MPTPRYGEYITVGTLMMGSRAIEAYDWDELMGASGKRGEDVTVEGQSGDVPLDRVTGSHRGLVKVRLNGEYDHATDAYTGPTIQAKVQKAYSLYAAFKAVASINTTQTLTLHHYGDNEVAQCIVVDYMSRGRLNPWVWEYVLDIKLPGGPMEIV